MTAGSVGSGTGTATSECERREIKNTLQARRDHVGGRYQGEVHSIMPCTGRS